MSDHHLNELIHDARPLSLPSSATVEEACRRMRERGCGATLVLEQGRLAGIFTGRDAVWKVLAAKRGADTPLREVMTPNPTTAPMSLSTIEALRLMQDCGIRHLPVVDQGAVVGLISRNDFGWLEKARLDEENAYFEKTW